MWKLTVLKSFLACLIISGWAVAQENASGEKSPTASEAKSDVESANRKAYDALFSDIIKSLPKEDKSKVDSARRPEAKADVKSDSKKHPKNPIAAENMKKKALENRKKEMDALPADVKDRVDKAVSRLEKKKKEKKSEFKELKD